ncbi:hypothetical protein ACFLQ1_00785 [Candidatus Auribacterota bacterium]
MIQKLKIFFGKESILIFLLVSIGFAIRLFFLLNSDDFRGELPMTRVYAAMNFLNNLDIKKIISSAYDFGHILLLTFSLKIFNDPSLSPRMTSLFFGSLFIIPFFYFIKNNFNKKTAVVSAIILIAYSLHINLSIISLAEIPAAFFLFLTFCFIIYPQQIIFSYPKIIFNAFFLSIAFLLRSEMIIFTLLISGYIWNFDKKKGLLFLLMSLIIPFWWAFLNWKVSGDFFWRLRDSNIASVEVTSLGKIFHNNLTLWQKIISLPYMISFSLSIPFVIVSLLGMIKELKNRTNTFIIFSFCTLFFIFSYKLINNSMTPLSRYALTGSLISIPFAVSFFFSLLDQISSKNFIRQFIIIFFILIFNFYSLNCAWQKKAKLPLAIKKLSQYLRGTISSQDKIIIDQDIWSLYLNNILVQSRLNPSQILVVRDKKGNKNLQKRRQEILNYITQKTPTYLLFCSKGYLPQLFNFSLISFQEKIFAADLRLLKTFRIDKEFSYFLYKFQ